MAEPCSISSSLLSAGNNGDEHRKEYNTMMSAAIFQSPPTTAMTKPTTTTTTNDEHVRTNIPKQSRDATTSTDQEPPSLSINTTTTSTTRGLFSPAQIDYLFQQHEALILAATAKLSPLATTTTAIGSNSFGGFSEESSLCRTPPPPFTNCNMTFASAKRLALEETRPKTPTPPTTLVVHGHHDPDAAIQPPMITLEAVTWKTGGIPSTDTWKTENSKDTLDDSTDLSEQEKDPPSSPSPHPAAVCLNAGRFLLAAGSSATTTTTTLTSRSWKRSGVSLLIGATLLVNVGFLLLLHMGVLHVEFHVSSSASSSTTTTHRSSVLSILEDLMTLTLKCAIFANVVVASLMCLGIL